jgi:hypothetical protein
VQETNRNFPFEIYFEISYRRCHLLLTSYSVSEGLAPPVEQVRFHGSFHHVGGQAEGTGNVPGVAVRSEARREAGERVDPVKGQLWVTVKNMKNEK